jgi:hypothetical protein
MVSQIVSESLDSSLQDGCAADMIAEAMEKRINPLTKHRNYHHPLCHHHHHHYPQ